MTAQCFQSIVCHMIISLMRDDVICLQFTTKLPLHDIFLEDLQPSCCFHEVILCIVVPGEFFILVNYKSAL